MAVRSASAEIEEATAAALTGLPPSWAVVRDPVWPGEQFPAIDHIVVGPPGIFVIDSRSFAGRLGVERGVLWQDGQDRTELLRTTAEAAVSVSGLAPSVRFDYVHGVICTVERNVPISWVDGVLICPAADVVAELTSYVEVIPGGVGKVVAVDIRRRLKEESPRARRRPPKAVGASKQAKPSKPAKPTSTRPLGVLAAMLALLCVLLAVSPTTISDVPGQIADLVDNVTNDNDNPLDGKTPKPPGSKKKQDKQERRGG